MTTYVLVHGAWHGGWAWARVLPALPAAIALDLSGDPDAGLRTHVDEVIAAIDGTAGPTVLVGHSYAGLVVREAADRRPDRVAHVVLVDGWAGGDGSSMFTVAPASFTDRVRAKVGAGGDDRLVPPPPPAVFGITDPADAAWLAPLLRPQPIRTFTEPTRLTGAVDGIPGTAIYCRPKVLPFAELGEQVGYRLVGLDGPHDVMVTAPAALARELLAAPRQGRR